MPKRERDLWTKVFDKSLQFRNHPRDSWPKKVEGQTVSVRLMNMVEDFYDLDQAPEEDTLQEDLFEEDAEPETMSCDYMNMQEEASADSAVSMKSVTVRCDRIDVAPSDVIVRRVAVSPSPAFPVEITNNQTGVSKCFNLTCDSGCTAECIVNAALIRSLGLPIQPTNVKTATLGDGETNMSIVGEVNVDTEYMGNPIKIKAVHSGS